VTDADVAIIGYFAELQERHAMTQTSEPGIKSEHSEGERTRGNGVVAEVPELWIIDELWQAVKTRQSEIADKYVNVTEAVREAQSNRLNGLRRPKALFSGLIHCGVCGGPCSLRGQDRYACSARVTNGSCANTRTIARTDLEQRVLAGLQGSDDGAGDRRRGDARLRRGDEPTQPRAPRQRLNRRVSRTGESGEEFKLR
jgi:Recombinase zinc beta ribbon domain